MAKYKYFSDNKRKVIAISTYAGKPVRGIAICSPEDTFDMEKGKEIAAARCNVKIAQKRLQRATKQHCEAYWAWIKAEIHLDNMNEYKDNAEEALGEAYNKLGEILRNT